MLEKFKKEKLTIKFDSVEEQKEFLEIAEKEGFEWSSGDKPTSFIPMIHDKRCYSNRYIEYDDDLGGLVYNGDEPFITWKDYNAEYYKSKCSFTYYSKAAKNILDDWTKSIISPNDIQAIYPNEKKRLVVVKWCDNSTTKVKCSKEDNFDVYIGVALAIAIKKYGTNSQFRKNVDKLVVGEKNDK